MITKDVITKGITIKVKVVRESREEQYTTAPHITEHATLETRFVPYIPSTVDTFYTVNHLIE